MQAFVYLMTKGREGDRKSSLGRGYRRFGEGLGSGVEGGIGGPWRRAPVELRAGLEGLEEGLAEVERVEELRGLQRGGELEGLGRAERLRGLENVE